MNLLRSRPPLRGCLPVILAAGMAACGGGGSGGPPSPQPPTISKTSMAAVVTSTGPGAGSLSVNNGTLYWLESGEDALKSVPVGGGTAQVLATRMVNPTSIAFAGADVIWSDCRSSDQVLKRTSATGATSVLAVGAECDGIANIAVAGPTVYWVATDQNPTDYNQQKLQATPVNGGATTTIAISGVPIPQIVASGEALYWLEFGPAGKSMSAIRSIPGAGGTITTLLSGFDAGAGTFALDTTSVYYTTSAGANAVDLVSRPLAGGVPTTLVSSIPPPTKLIIAGANVVWIDGAGQVRSVPVGGGSPLTLAGVSGSGGDWTPLLGPFDVVFDGINVVWTEATNFSPLQIGSVRAVPPTGGAVVTLYQSSDLPRQLAMDPASHLNWIDSGARIARLDASNSAQTVAWGLGSHTVSFVVTGGSLIFPDGQRVRSIPLAGGPPSTLIVDYPAPVNLDYLATDGTSLVWNDLLFGTLKKAPVAGGAVTELVQGDYSTAAGGGSTTRPERNGVLGDRR